MQVQFQIQPNLNKSVVDKFFFSLADDDAISH